MSIILRTTHSPEPWERQEHYNVALSNTIERLVLQGQDPRQFIRQHAERQARGEHIQNVLVQRFAGSKTPTTLTK